MHRAHRRGTTTFWHHVSLTGSLNHFSQRVLEGKRRKVWGLAVRRCLWAAPCEQLLALPAAQHQTVGSSTSGSTSWERSLCFTSLLSARRTPELLRQQQFGRIWCCLCWKQREDFYLKGFQIRYFGGKAPHALSVPLFHHFSGMLSQSPFVLETIIQIKGSVKAKAILVIDIASPGQSRETEHHNTGEMGNTGEGPSLQMEKIE